MKRGFMVFFVCICVGCAKSGSIAHDDLNLEYAFQDIQQEILEKNWKIGTLSEDAISEEQLIEDYGISSADVDAYMVKQAILPASCGEIAIFHLKDENTGNVEAAIAKRVEALREELSMLPAQKQCILQYQKSQIGNYMIFVIGADAQNVIQYISSL